MAQKRDAAILGIYEYPLRVVGPGVSSLQIKAESAAKALEDAGLDVPVVVGGIVPDSDLEAMAEAGVAGVLGPGASAEDVAKCVREAVATRGE